MFKKGDYVKIKPGTEIEEGENIANWAGVIAEVQEDNLYLVHLDATSLDGMSDAYLMSCEDYGSDPNEYVFEDTDLEPAAARHTEAENRAALARANNRMEELEDEKEPDTAEIWSAAYQESEQYRALNDSQREDAPHVVTMFADYMLRYEDEYPEEWSVSATRHVCLVIIPGKVSESAEFFENVGPALRSFFTFLAEKKLHSRATKLTDLLREISKEIATRAADPANWHMAKSMLMPAVEQGLDLSDEAVLNRYMRQQQMNALQNLGQGVPAPRQPTQLTDPFRGYSRNERVTVRYAGGKVKEGIKFKYVEKDLRSGKCELV